MIDGQRDVDLGYVDIADQPLTVDVERLGVFPAYLLVRFLVEGVDDYDVLGETVVVFFGALQQLLLPFGGHFLCDLSVLLSLLPRGEVVDRRAYERIQKYA